VRTEESVEQRRLGVGGAELAHDRLAVSSRRRRRRSTTIESNRIESKRPDELT
jgi:hypothetical protein